MEEKKEKSLLERKLEEMEKNSPPATSGSLVTDNQAAEEEKLRYLQEKLESFRNEYEAEKEKATQQARKLLEEVAKVFLTEKMFSHDDYVKSKLETETAPLANLLFQIDVTNRAIYRLSENMHMSNGSNIPRTAEVLGSLVRVSLDISKFYFDYTQNIENSLRKLKSDYELKFLEEEEATGNINESETVKTQKSLIIRDNRQLVEELQLIVSEAKSKIKIVPSDNPKLNGNFTDFEEVKDEISTEGDETLDTF